MFGSMRNQRWLPYTGSRYEITPRPRERVLDGFSSIDYYVKCVERGAQVALLCVTYFDSFCNGNVLYYLDVTICLLCVMLATAEL